VQGFSAVIEGRRGGYLALSDNGFGARENSADFLLRLHRVAPRLETRRGGTGTIALRGFVSLRDPDRRIPFPIVGEGTHRRLLTGADLDVESVRRDAHGDLWLGDEFGPFILHTDRRGRALEAPIPIPGVASPQNPLLASPEDANVPSSRGLEGMAISPNGSTLFPMLEGALIGDPDQRRRLVYSYDIPHGEFAEHRWQYRVEAPEHAIGDLSALDGHRLLVIERDDLQGAEAAFKRVYLIDLRETDAEGYLVKRELVDLLEVRDPDGISLPAREGDIGLGDPFAFPFQTVESLLPIGRGRLLVLNDNNYPFSAGRNPGRPDDTEAIVVEVPALRALEAAEAQG